ncbi:MAG: DUF6155 family protein [Bacteroidetes bacterium]|nr:DUF6155 family protein [Bacteroidota bacterium]
MGIKEIKKELNVLSKDKLVQLIVGLYQKNKLVKEQLEFHFNPNEKDLLKLYKEKVLEAFYPRRGDMFHLKIGKRAISDFKKLKPSLESQIDLMIYYVECGVKLTLEYGDIDDNFYSSLEGVYFEALKLIDKNEFHKIFEERAFEIVNKTNNIGWGFHDAIGDIYAQTYQQ